MTPRARAPGPQPVKAVLFDSDGLLIDSETIYTDVVNEVLKPYGKEQTWEIKGGWASTAKANTPFHSS